MIRFVWRTDVHLSDRTPSSRKDNWTDTVFRKLDQVRNVAKKVGAAAILDGGDFFHIKSPGRNSHALVHRALDHHATYPCPVYCTPGNHDSVYGDYAFLPQQPLGVLFASGSFRRLYDEHEAVFEQGGVKVRVVGIPYHGTSYDMDRFHSIEKGDEDYLVCVAHVLASTKGGTMFEGEDIVKYKDLLDTAPDVYFFGHWHKDQGVVSMGDKTFINIGSLTRGSLSQDEMERKPACAFISFTKDEEPLIRVVRLKVEDPHEVFDVEGRVRQEKQQVEMDAFVTRIRESLQEGSEAASLSSLVTGMEDIPAQVRERALAYLEQA
tara:strand:- start:295 stop:1260 length:966 start_codon:yes stop_codon:yes gene_type:complete